MTIKLEHIEKALVNIENKVGTGWLEKWVHEIRDLEFNAAPTKNQEDLQEKIPPMAVTWCKARDEVTLSSITGDLKLGEVLVKAYEIGRSLSKCEGLPGLCEHIDLLKSEDKYRFEEAGYSLAVAAGYTGLGYKPFLGNPFTLEHLGSPVQVICQAKKMLSPKDLEFHKFWLMLSTELGRLLNFYKLNHAVLITAGTEPQVEDVVSIINELFPKNSVNKNSVEVELDIISKYKVRLTPLNGHQCDNLFVLHNYEFRTVIGSSIIALKLEQSSDRENEITRVCEMANAIADKKIPTILYVDISLVQAEKYNRPLVYYTEQMKKYISSYENLAKIVFTGCFSGRSTSGLNYYLSDSINNKYAKVHLPEGFIPFIPG